jgi:hypothetical protein
MMHVALSSTVLLEVNIFISSTCLLVFDHYTAMSLGNSRAIIPHNKALKMQLSSNSVLFSDSSQSSKLDCGTRRLDGNCPGTRFYVEDAFGHAAIWAIVDSREQS